MGAKYEYFRKPFRLKNAPQIFERVYKIVKYLVDIIKDSKITVDPAKLQNIKVP